MMRVEHCMMCRGKGWWPKWGRGAPEHMLCEECDGTGHIVTED